MIFPGAMSASMTAFAVVVEIGESIEVPVVMISESKIPRP
jgi:hypothetical protein